VRQQDAAPIAADSDPEGGPHVSNGLALPTLHHAAFEYHILGCESERSG
jgi:hypothetical protein